MLDILAGEVNGTLNVHGKSRDPRARLLSALANRPFEMNGQMFASLEGWYQGIKFPLTDPRRRRAFASCFGHAKQFSAKAERKFVWWNDEEVVYSSPKHKKWIEEAFQASFDQNPDRMEALLATQGLVLLHETGEDDAPDAPITRREFCDLLTRIRKKASQ